MLENIHHNIAKGSWFEKDLCEQMGNVGSEVGRAVNWQKKGNAAQQEKALDRAFDLLDLTMSDSRWQKSARLKEICRVRELLADVFYGENQYHDSPAGLEKYFYQFALMARLSK
ncbi:MAG: hypothetical protein UX10_C0017G0014 [Candidatus Magasanikbacteria bacterium GW2011_GWA2_45_39]|uniref:S23 ribosomal protein n=2 Tax=Candidatus Magasanikiibacteriota TaxID=1752731 RepID=A0A0G1QYN9_9BACT|nr:MAG: hypothetical protein UX10_C0017G0014 [Candidatus Magasanikbacteria bacterium GW2011_GWA2_45_39]KKU13790.1 MAG: hypothetical protein UX20_C0013G0014 [Candidatus Magasanikbacteria bacterium GW2011_GWC2_45_8]HBW74290.1 hypothetical protein [Candidatus Magasanikbacteria bacterium]